ncbi:hypothetical protein RZS28_00865 [Methylocapsa polymorpha]|uniref:Uncharacterized protein n=1 Tax=Methylocapsa polymorpha TaxID=3080828 RepID=A0ABZ0HU17_9HYPH|nr:hypothetical protein RZS28_00865 [Methylocapsa sp. RX1]
MVDLGKLVKQYMAEAASLQRHVESVQKSTRAASLIGEQIAKHPRFKTLPVESQRLFASSQESVAKILQELGGMDDDRESV